MFIFTIEAFACTASFRIPENHTFQQTLPLPPITTLIGMMGAALGLDYQHALEFRKNHDIGIGIIGSHAGEMKDLWKYNKIKSVESCKDVLIREYLTDLQLTIAFGSGNKEILEKLKESFSSPVYPITAGNSDDLMKLKTISTINSFECEQCNRFENILLSGNQLADYETSIDLKNTSITFSIRAPQVFRLPTDFSFNVNERRVKSRDFYTFVGSPIQIKKTLPVYRIEGKVFHLL